MGADEKQETFVGLSMKIKHKNEIKNYEWQQEKILICSKFCLGSGSFSEKCHLIKYLDLLVNFGCKCICNSCLTLNSAL